MACQRILTREEMVAKSTTPIPELVPPCCTAIVDKTTANEIATRIQEIREQMIANIEVEEVFDTAHKKEIRRQYRKVFRGVKCVLVSMEGALFTIEQNGVIVTPGAVEAFAKLQQSSLKVLIVTNTWLKSKQRILKLLNKLGFVVKEKDLFTSSDCCKLFMKNHELKHPFMLVSDDVLKDFPGMETLNPLEFDSVVLGLPSTMIDYRLMTKTLSLLFDERPLLVLNSAKSEKAFGSTKITAPGHYGQSLEFATDAIRYTPAKPTIGFYVEACKYAGFPPKRCVMIGDCIGEDVRDPHTICMKAVLVKTGKYQFKDEDKYCGVTPELLVSNFFKASTYILCATGTDPDKGSDKLRDAERTAKWEREQGDFKTRLREYSKGCGNPPKTICPKKLDSIIW